MTTTKPIRLLMLLPFVALCGGAILVGQAFPPGEWYAQLKRPAITPPSWAFGVVWTPLYLMIAVAGWLLWEQACDSWAMRLWGVQLALNAAWSWVFFGLHRPGTALIEMGALWAAIGATIVAAWSRQRTAAWLLVPYWGWVVFAALLNYEFWRLNR